MKQSMAIQQVRYLHSIERATYIGHKAFSGPMMNSNGNDPQLTAKIVSKYVSHHRVAGSQLPELINTVHQAMGQIGTTSDAEEARTPAVSIRQSVRQNHVVCLECGY